MADLRDCPFCGSANIAIGYEGQPAHSFFMRCVDCGACGPSVRGATPLGGFPATLGIEWNLRSVAATAPQQPVQDKPAALTEAVGKLIKAKGRFHTEQNYAAVVAAYDSAILAAAPAPDTGGADGKG